MKKALLFIFLITPLLSISQEITINYNFPNEIQNDKSFVVNVEIFKSDLETFAQYKQVLPDGFTVTDLNNSNANFCFEENTITYSWSKLPEVSLLKLSYSIVSNNFLKEKFETNGQFSYIVNNSRGVISTSNTIVSLKQNEIVNTEINVANSDTTKKVVEDLNCDVKVVRNIKVINKKEISVELIIDKCDYSAMSIIQETIPPDFTAKFTDNDTIKSDYKLGILTLNIEKMPEKNETFIVNYTLSSDSLIIEYPSISGKYKYVKKGELIYVTVNEGIKVGDLHKEEIIEKKEENIIKEEVKKDSGENEIIKFLNE